MNAIPYHSTPQLLARLTATQAHEHRKPPQTKPEQRRRKSDRIDFKREQAACIYGYLRGGVEL